MARILVVGFDGATLDLSERWRAEGRMPALAAIMGDGSYGPMRSVAPYNSAVAWVSLATGVSPARHGIFDFVLPRAGGYGWRVATREDRRVAALWTLASEAGAHVAVVNIPMTFPAEPVSGVMVSGMDAPRLDARAVSPQGHLDFVRAASPGYRIMSKAARHAEGGDFEGAERELLDVLRSRAAYVRELVRSDSFDLVMVNLEATDGAHHFLWQHMDPAHPRHDAAAAARLGPAIRRVYEASDLELGRLVEAFRPDTVFVVSDHGGGPSSDWVLFMNEWLCAEGLLALAPRAVTSIGQRLYAQAKRRLSVPARRSLRPILGPVLERAKGASLYGDVDWGRTRAYAHMQPAVRLNLAGREPGGVVREADRDRVLDEVASRATALRLPDGTPAFSAVHRASEVYGGEAAGAPDLVMDLAPGLHVRSRNTTGRPGFVGRLGELGLYLPSGVHTPVGMVAAAGSGIDRLGEIAEGEIHQVAASVLAVMGVPAAPGSGAPLGFVSALPAPPTTARGAPGEHRPAQTGPGERTGLSEEEEAQVVERLRGLGYVD